VKAPPGADCDSRQSPLSAAPAEGSGDAAADDGGRDGGGPSHGSDAGPDASVQDGGSRPPDGGACNFAGTRGAEVTMDVTWAAGAAGSVTVPQITDPSNPNTTTCGTVRGALP
jgi:hypothetical protein